MLGPAEHVGQILPATHRTARRDSNTHHQSQCRIERDHTMKATAHLPGAPDANSALADSARNKSQPADGTSVMASAVTSMSISTLLVPSPSVTRTVTPARAIGRRAFSPIISIQIATSVETGCYTVT